ncbi:hypothetical protein [Candidatus Enterococcus ikei]|uniref:hypothetical protein n=1 Tax=Candidatus Enterococcus ikei TaxID=2815326 RepID=UPI001F5DB0D5|nr:hypothetical protein [Enterococcus sp. DIV0869a]
MVEERCINFICLTGNSGTFETNLEIAKAGADILLLPAVGTSQERANKETIRRMRHIINYMARSVNR